MRDDHGEDFSQIDRSVILGEDGSVTTRYGYEYAVRRLYEYERSGITPDGDAADLQRHSWVLYTMKAPNGEIFACRGWEHILGRLFANECSGLTPEQWRQKHT